MTAYSYQPMFVKPIAIGLGILEGVAEWLRDMRPEFRLEGSDEPKRQTIRAPRGGYGHAKPGDVLQLYCQQRLPKGFKIGNARCVDVKPIAMRVVPMKRYPSIAIDGVFAAEGEEQIERFARADGFSSWSAMQAFWARHHPGVTDFEGWIIYWEPIT